jgi:hypothetical protein
MCEAGESTDAGVERSAWPIITAGFRSVWRLTELPFVRLTAPIIRLETAALDRVRSNRSVAIMPSACFPKNATAPISSQGERRSRQLFAALMEAIFLPAPGNET